MNRILGIESREYECNNCGKRYDVERYLDADGMCECGGGLFYIDSYESYSEYTYYGINNVNNLLEDKRSGRYKRR